MNTYNNNAAARSRPGRGGTRRVLPAVALTILLALGVLAQPVQAGEGDATTIPGPSGRPVNPQCANDNNYEYTGAQGSEMFFPNDRCSVDYDPTGYGIPPDAKLLVVHIDYRVTGHEGTICGKFELGGRVLGSTPYVCTSHDQRVSVDVQGTSSGSSTRIITLTWRASTPYDNAYLSGFVAQEWDGASVPPPPPTCEVMVAGTCLVPEPGCVVGPTSDCTVALPNAEETVLAACRATFQKAEIVERQTGQSPPVDRDSCSTDPPCVAGSDPRCTLPEPCLLGRQEDGCWVDVGTLDCNGFCREVMDPVISVCRIVVSPIPVPREVGRANCAVL